MLREEFEARMGNTVTPEAFEDIHELYIASGDMDKDTFCDDWKLHGTSKILAEIWPLYKDMRKVLELYKKEHQKAAELLVDIFENYGVKEARDMAEEMIYDRGIIRYKLEHGKALTADERDYILSKI